MCISSNIVNIVNLKTQVMSLVLLLEMYIQKSGCSAGRTKIDPMTVCNFAKFCLPNLKMFLEVLHLIKVSTLQRLAIFL